MRSERPLIVVLAGAIVAFALSVLVDWQAGLFVLGADLLVGASLRLLLPDLRIGLLAVRSRALDAAMLVLAGGAIIVIGASLGRTG